MGVRNDIEQGLAARLAKITNANGYNTNVKQIYYNNKMPLGIQLEDHEVPAILLIAGKDEIERKRGCIIGNWMFYIQMIHTDVPDSTMFEFTREVFKSLYADDPVADVLNAYLTIAPHIRDLIPIDLDPDLNMIDSNRLGVIRIAVQYVSQLNNL